MDFLGPLQAAVMHVMWSIKHGDVSDVHTFVMQTYDSQIQYTTILTTLNTLARKGFVKKQKSQQGRRNDYVVEINKEDYQVFLLDYINEYWFDNNAAAMQDFLTAMGSGGHERNWIMIPMKERAQWARLVEQSQQDDCHALIASLMLVLDQSDGSITVPNENYQQFNKWACDSCPEADLPLICSVRR